MVVVFWVNVSRCILWLVDHYDGIHGWGIKHKTEWNTWKTSLTGKPSLAGQMFAARGGGGKECLVTIDRFS